MISITQLGHKFQYRKAESGNPVILETWGIERVAAFMFVIELNRMLSQRYVKALTFINHIGATQYSLNQFDGPTNRDVTKLINLMAKYTEPPESFRFHTTMENAINIAEALIKEAVAEQEAPVEIKGVTYTRERFLERPTEEEYANQHLQSTSPQVEAVRAENPDKVHYIDCAGWGIIPCIIIKETPKTYTYDGYVLNRKVVEGARINKESPRIIS